MESRKMSHLVRSNYSNMAQLKDLMTVPPMTAEQHAAVMRKRNRDRRMVEEAREMKKSRGSQFEKQ
jgi:hypothetical protein